MFRKIRNFIQKPSMLIGSIIFILSLVIGIVLDFRNFALNVLAGIVDLFFGFFLGVYVLNRVLENRQEQQWEKVREITVTSISSHLCDLMAELIIKFQEVAPKVWDYHIEISEGRTNPNQRTNAAMKNLTAYLEGALSNQEDVSHVVVSFYKKVQWDLDRLGYILTPRVLQFSNNQNIIDALIEFDDARHKLQNSVMVQEEMSIGYIYPSLILLMTRAQKLYSVLIQ